MWAYTSPWITSSSGSRAEDQWNGSAGWHEGSHQSYQTDQQEWHFPADNDDDDEEDEYSDDQTVESRAP